MRAAIIGASEEAIHTIEIAKKHHIEIVALDGNPKAKGLIFADIPKVVDISREEETIQAVKEAQVDCVLTVPIGRFLTTIGAVNDALHLPGISKQMAVGCTDKYTFHIKLQGKGLRPCHCFLIEQDGTKEKEQQAIEKSKTVSYPAILKPRYGSGSRGIYFLEKKEEFPGVLSEIGEESYILEELMPGQEYGVDMAVTQNKTYFILLRAKENTPLPARQAVSYRAVMPDQPVYQEIKAYMEQVIECLGLQDCLLHGDIMYGEKGPFAIEVSARPSGHNLHNLFTPLCTGIDPAESYLLYRMTGEEKFQPGETKDYMIHYFDMEGMVRQVPSKEQVNTMFEGRLLQWNCQIQAGDYLGPVVDGHSLMGRGFFILDVHEKSATQIADWIAQLKRLFIEGE